MMFGAFFCRATAEERAASLPGDEDIPSPVTMLDHGIDIAAPPEAVWPWLAQMGAYPKAGWYSYDVLDNRGHTSLGHLDPALGSIALGSVFPALPDVTDCFILTAFETNRFLLLAVPAGDRPDAGIGSTEWRRSFSRANWTWLLKPTRAGTRIHVRARLGWLQLNLPVLGPVTVRAWLASLLAAPIHFIMQRRQLHNIRSRVETAMTG